ncbi:unnamed protein product [Caenorhabditis sp. 36 PRJEB53466]|nr:unnamed protein product [Caenorhabditis sp. 36 PRJEB53466]
MYGDRRKTGGPTFGGPRMSTAITPTKRFTDFGTSSSVRKVDGRLSMSQTGARLSLFQKNSAAAPRDVKQLAPENVNKIYNFLIEFEGPNAPAEKDIRCPGSKQHFINLFELIYQHLSKDYEYPTSARLEEEISSIFKGLGYPHALKNSYFAPMGSSLGYPHVLEALSWLIDLIRCNMGVSAHTDNIILEDFMEPAKVQEKLLLYSWLTTTFREYTNDRKAAETKEGPFWQDTQTKLRNYFENADDFEDMVSQAKNQLEQFRFECEEIDADKGNEQGLTDEINKIKEDIMKANDYKTNIVQCQTHKEEELNKVKEVLTARTAENAMVQAEVNALKELIDVQKRKHNLTGKQARQMNAENDHDKEIVLEIQAELDQLSKQMWLMKNEDTFKEQKAVFVQFIESIEKIIAGIDVKLEPLRAPANEQDLKAGWETLNSVWMPEVNRQLNQKKLQLQTELSRFGDKFAAIEQRVQMEKEMLGEANKKEAREERVRRNEREEWKEDRLQREKRYDEMENEKDVLKKQLQMDGSLDKEIQTEKSRMKKLEEDLQRSKASFEGAIRKKVDLIHQEAADIDNEKMLFHVECTEYEKQILKNRD